MRSPEISRRSLLGLGADAAAAAAIASCAGGATSSRTAPVALRAGSFVSRFRPQEPTGWSIAVPGTPNGPTSGSLPVALFLHGAHADNRMVFDDLGADRVLAT